MPEAYALAADTIAGLPCLTLAGRETPTDAPLAVILHGLGRHKESTLAGLYALARRGLRALAFDARLHGERPGAEAREGRLQADYVLTMAEIIEGTAQDLSPLLDAMNVSEAAVHGISLGGYVAYAALTMEPRLTVAAVAMGSPDWLGPLREMGLAPGHPVYDAVAARSPLERAAETYPRAPCFCCTATRTTSSPSRVTWPSTTASGPSTTLTPTAWNWSYTPASATSTRTKCWTVRPPGSPASCASANINLPKLQIMQKYR